MSAVVRMKIHFPSESTRRASASRSASLARLEPRAAIDDDERRAHPELRDRRSPRRALDPPVEAVDEDAPRARGSTTFPAMRTTSGVRRSATPRRYPCAAEREERGREADRGDPQVRDGVVRGLALAAHERDELLGEHGDERRDGDAEREREPDRLRAEPSRGLLLAGAARARDLRGRPVLEEVEDREDARRGS